MTSLYPPNAPGAVKAQSFSRAPRTALAAFVLAAVALLSVLAPRAGAAVDPVGCTETIQYDPSIPTFTQFATEKGFANTTLGGFGSGTASRHISSQLYEYEEALAAATANNPRVRILVRDIGPTTGESAPGVHRKFQYSIIGTPQNIANVETDAAWYRDVRAGVISKEAALADFKSNHRPAMAWITETPHGNEPAGGEASIRMLYELAARTDCANMARLQALDVFIDPARNPDGRDNNTRTTAWSFDPNRDLMYQTQDVNRAPMDEIFKYPGLFFIDAHQQTTGYFFPPNEDPVHHEISHFALDEIQDIIGPALQNRFNDQSLQYRNYNAYDLFTPEYGDAVPSLLLGSAGMTYEKGSSENYGKQVYDHYLAMDETVNVVAKEKNQLVEGWIGQWQQATEQGANCELQENVLVSPLHETIEQQPNIGICGYYFKPGNHSGDTAHIIELLRDRGVHVYKLDQSVEVQGAHDWGKATTTTVLPAGTLWIPAAQTMKHWIDAVLEEKPFQPYAYFYDVVDWSFPELNDLAGDGQLQSQLPNVPMTEVSGELQLGTTTGGEKPVLAFSTDSTQALGLVTKLLAQGVTVFRAKEAFDAAGTHFPTGAALVDAPTLGNTDIAGLAAAAQTAVTGLDAFPPVPRFAIKKPKIAVYTGATTVPTNPMFKGAGTGQCTSTAFCEMLYTLAEADGIPASLLTPVTTTELSNGVLTTGNFTALVSANNTLATTGTPISPATALQQFVNAGGNYVVYGANGATSMRNAGISTLNTSSTATWNAHCADNTNPAAPGELTTPGTAFSGTFNTADPVAWGFDEGGYVYRDVSSTSTAPVLDPNTLAGNATIPAATPAVSYATDMVAFGYQCNAFTPPPTQQEEVEGKTPPTHLPGRPYVVDQPFGAGHSTLIGSDPYFRAWNTGAQRFVLNGILLPNTAPIGAAAPASARTALAAKPLLRRRLPKVRTRPARANHEKLADVVLTVKRAKLPVLKRILRHAKLPHAVRRQMRWIAGPRHNEETLRILNASSFARREKGDARIVKGSALWTFGDLELRPAWAWRIIDGLNKYRLPYQRQI